MYIDVNEHELALIKEAMLNIANHPKENRHAIEHLNKRIQGLRYPHYADPILDAYVIG
jgi:hypothetical protein